MDATPTPSPGPSRERAVFEAALDLGPGARTAFLAAECGADDALRRRVAALLAAADEGDTILPDVPAAPATPTPPGMLLERPGTTIGRYTLLEEIGEGGCGVVYMAEQRDPVRRRVALKILKPGMDTRSVVARFEAERQALALMDHPNIARVLDGGATDTGRPFFVMELVRGIRITDFCDERRLPARERLGLFVQVCNAIQHAHQKGIVHRDIKPSNILVTVNDDVAVPKVIDFGIAKATGQPLTDKTLVTRFHAFVGTPAYMSPEQAEFSSVDIDTRSDVYSLGVLLYELLVGRTPFDGEEILKDGIEGVRRTLRDTPATAPSAKLDTFAEAERTRTAERRRCDVPRLKSEIQGDLDWIVLKCLEKDRMRRYESVGALAQDIQRSLRNEPVDARPPTWSYRARKTIERHRVAFAAGTLLAGTLVAASVFSAAMAWRERVARGAAERASHRAEAEALAARRAAYAADMLSARAALDEGQPGRARALLASHVPRAGDEDLRGVEWRLLAWTARDESLRRLPHPGPVQRMATSPDGRRFATACTDGIVRIWDAATLEKSMELKAAARALVFSPDGAWLAVATRDGTVLHRTTTWEPARVIPGLAPPLCFDSDGLHLHGVEGGRWVRWDLDGRERVVPPEPLPSRAPEVAVALSGNRSVVAAYGRDGLVAIVPGTPGAEPVRLRGIESVESLAASPDGRWVAAGNWHGTVVAWDTRDGHEAARFEALRRGAEAVAFSPDGRQLVAGGRDQLVRILAFDPDGAEGFRETGILRGHSHDITGVRFLADGARLASCSTDGTARVWDFAGHREEAGPRIRGLGSLIYEFDGDATEFHALEAKGMSIQWGDHPTHVLSTHRLPLVPKAMPLGAGDGTAFLEDGAGRVARWDLRNRKLLWELRRGSAPLVPMAWSAKAGTVVLAEYGGMGRLHVFRPPATEPERSFDDFRGEYNVYTRMAAISPDGRWLAYPGPDQSVRVVDLATGTPHATLEGLPWIVTAIAMSCDGRRVAAGSRDGSLVVWDRASGKAELGPFPAHGAPLNHVEFSSDGKTVLTTAFAGGLRLWNAENGRCMASIPEAESTAAPLLAGDDRALVFWNLRTGDLERHPAPPLASFGPTRR